MKVSIVSVAPGIPDPDYLTQARSHKTGRWLDINPATPFEGEETTDNAKAYMLKLKTDPVVLACIGTHPRGPGPGVPVDQPVPQFVGAGERAPGRAGHQRGRAPPRPEPVEHLE